ncbi:MAG: DUF192 domain-containing protein [Pseudomonadota bacterium]
MRMLPLIALSGIALSVLAATAVAEPVTVRIPAGEAPALAVEAEVAESPAERRQGLMHRESLSADAGMLFVYDRPRGVSMWMANTHIPLDMIFIDPDCRVRRVARDTEPESREPIPAGGETALVLEVNAGVAGDIEPGMAVAAPPWCPASE